MNKVVNLKRFLGSGTEDETLVLEKAQTAVHSSTATLADSATNATNSTYAEYASQASIPKGTIASRLANLERGTRDLLDTINVSFWKAVGSGDHDFREEITPYSHTETFYELSSGLKVISGYVQYLEGVTNLISDYSNTYVINVSSKNNMPLFNSLPSVKIMPLSISANPNRQMSLFKTGQFFSGEQPYTTPPSLIYACFRACHLADAVGFNGIYWQIIGY